MRHPNATLKGRLYAHELPEEKHLRSKFGYWRHVEERMIREELRAEGVKVDELPYFDLQQMIIARVEENHRHDETYRETSQRILVRAKEVAESRDFNREELERIVDHFEGANDPVSVSLLMKARGAIERMEGLK